MTDLCVHLQCDRVSRARGLCEKHYGQLKRAGLGPLMRKEPARPSGLQGLCQLGQNRSCVDCGDSPWGGGMRCLPCFQRRVEVRRAALERQPR
jgi:hypothetical protein